MHAPANNKMRKVRNPMKKLTSLFLTIALVLAMVPSALAADFTDVKAGYWYDAAVDYVVDNKLMGGYNATTFGPDDNLSRAMMAQILYNKEGKPAVSGTSAFADVKADDWFSAAVTWAAEKGIMSGYNATTFGPDNAVTLEQLAVILWNYSGKPASTASADYVGTHSSWANDGLAWAVEKDILANVPYLAATDGATRAQTAQVLTNFLSPAKSTMDPVLKARRDAAEAYMRRMATVRFRLDEDLVYTYATGKTPEQDAGNKTCLTLKAGRIYQGVPYSYAAGTDTAFLEYAVGEPENGIYTISGITWDGLSGESDKHARLGNDCASSLGVAWGSIGADVVVTNTQAMTYHTGYIRVGNYVSHDYTNSNSAAICKDNGEQTMYAAYAQLQKADGLVYRRTSDGHTMMALATYPVYNADGTIDGDASTIIIMDQTPTPTRNEDHFFDETLQEDVYRIYRTTSIWTYNQMYTYGGLPVTCRAFLDPTPIEEPKVTDTLFINSTGEKPQLNKNVLLTGSVESNWMIDSLTMTITDAAGKVVQEGAIRSVRAKTFLMSLSRFEKDQPGAVRGYIKPEELAAGNYHCKLVCRLVAGDEFVVRDFDFTV